jgi:hypothetical protein
MSTLTRTKNGIREAFSDGSEEYRSLTPHGPEAAIERSGDLLLYGFDADRMYRIWRVAGLAPRDARALAVAWAEGPNSKEG